MVHVTLVRTTSYQLTVSNCRSASEDLEHLKECNLSFQIVYRHIHKNRAKFDNMETTSVNKPIPKFAELPLAKQGPRLNAWGLYGPDDQLGTLNRLTDDVVKRAAQEIQTGTRINLDWALDAQGDVPFFGRQSFEKTIHQKPNVVVNDDIWKFNTQSSSQWDGFRHFGYQKEVGSH